MKRATPYQMEIPLQTVKRAIEQGYVVSMWREKQRDLFTCEMSKPAWAGSCCNTANTMRKAVKKTWKECQEQE